MKSLKRHRNRRGRCYELAAIAMQDEPGAEKFTLVHGFGPLGVPHAWIETGDGRVYDPVADTYTAIEDYAGVAQCRYTRLEAAQAACDDHTSGPWHFMQYGKLGDDLVAIGRIMLRGEAGFAAYDTDNRLVGNFPDSDSAVAALFALVPQAKRRRWERS
jgi:hypothetical protein